MATDDSGSLSAWTSSSSHFGKRNLDQIHLHKPKNENNEDQDQDQAEIENVNNKKSERLQKPCKNGFCYCYTSDSSDLHGNKIKARKMKSGRRSIDSSPQPLSLTSSSSSLIKDVGRQNVQDKFSKIQTNLREIVLSDDSSQSSSIQEYRKCTIFPLPKRKDFILKSKLQEAANDEPLIRIIQEIHENMIISKIRVNRSKFRRKRPEVDQTTLVAKTSATEAEEIGSNKCSTGMLEHLEVSDSGTTIESVILAGPARSRNKKGGKLYQKRISSLGEVNTNLDLNIGLPPRKPPRRRFSNKCEKHEEGIVKHVEGKVEENQTHVKTTENKKRHSESSNGSKSSEIYYPAESMPVPSCPPASEMTFSKFVSNETPREKDDNVAKLGWVSPRIADMINYENDPQAKDLKSSNLVAQPQSIGTSARIEESVGGWVPPPRINIDTVDSPTRFRQIPKEELNNFCNNVGSKSTPIKRDELIAKNYDRRSIDESFLMNKTLPNEPKEDNYRELSFSKKALNNTRTFFEYSRNRLFGLMRRNSNNRKSFPPAGNMRSVSVQTSQLNLAEEKFARRSLFEETKSIENNSFIAMDNIPQASTNLTNNMNESRTSHIFPDINKEFDFNRIVNSPEREKGSFSFRKTFSPRKAIKSLTTSTPGTLAAEKEGHSYKSFDSDISRDLSIAAVNCILQDIRDKLENVDEEEIIPKNISYAVSAGATHVAPKNVVDSTENKNNFQEGCGRMSAYADVHVSPQDLQEPIYAEIPNFNTSQTRDTVNVPENTNKSAAYSSNNKDCKCDSPVYSQVVKNKGRSQSDGDIVVENIQQNQNSCNSEVAQGQSTSCSSDMFIANLFTIQPNDNASNSNFGTDPKNTTPELSRYTAHEWNPEEESYKHQDEKIYDDVSEYHFSNSNSKECPSEDDTKLENVQNTVIELPIIVQSVPSTSTPLPSRAVIENNRKAPSSSSSSSLNGKSRSNSRRESLNERILNITSGMHSNSNSSIGRKSKSSSLKRKLRASIRRGRTFLKQERKRFFQALDRSSEKVTTSNARFLSRTDDLFRKDVENATDLSNSLHFIGNSNTCAAGINNNNNNNNNENCLPKSIVLKQQLGQVLNFCREMPQLQSSTELVEAERLFLYSTLKTDSLKRRKNEENFNNPSNFNIPSIPVISSESSSPSSDDKKSCLSIISVQIPLKSNYHYDTFFNYFYIGVFSSGTIVKSTNSVEKRGDSLLFQTPGITFNNLETDFEIILDIYMLRLRKITFNSNSLSLRRKKRLLKKKTQKNSCNSSDSGDEPVSSRFRLHGRVKLRAEDFIPYTLMTPNDDNNSSMIFHSSSSTQERKIHLKQAFFQSKRIFTFPINFQMRNTNLSNEIILRANVDLFFEQHNLEGFLNIKRNHHNWERYWCKLIDLTLYFWHYPQDYKAEDNNRKDPILQVNLLDIKCNEFPIVRDASSTRPKFILNVFKIEDQPEKDNIIHCCTDNADELNYWVSGLSNVMEFIKKWIQKEDYLDASSF